MKTIFVAMLAFVYGSGVAIAAEPLPNTGPLTRAGDLAAQMVEGIDKYLMRELEAAPAKRSAAWKWDSSTRNSLPSVESPARSRLRTILGVVDARVPKVEVEYLATMDTPALVAKTSAYEVRAVRWPVLPGVDAEGLLLEPKGKPVALIVALPDADWTPEMYAGLAAGVPEALQHARLLAENGCRVLVPTLIDRKDTWSGNPQLGRMTNQPHREFVYRMSFEMGRHVIGYEVQKVLAAVDWFTHDKDGQFPGNEQPRVGVAGYGEGGLIALYSKALDYRIRGALISGCFGPCEGLWQEPIYRNVWGLLRDFGDAELAGMIDNFALNDKGQGKQEAPDRSGVFVEHVPFPKIDGPPQPHGGRSGAAPGKIVTPDNVQVQQEFARLTGNGTSALCLTPADAAVSKFFRFIQTGANAEFRSNAERPVDVRKVFDGAARQKRQFDQLIAFTQKLMRDSEAQRQKNFWSKLDTSSPQKYAALTEPFRKQLWEEVIGKLPPPALPPNPKSRRVYDEPKWTGYEVTLDLYPDVFAEGILLLPKDLQPGEKRPVIVCQHGLEGRPADVVNPKQKTQFYNSFGAQLADKGYIVYAPQNPYIGGDKFRVLQRKANPLGLSLFSFIIRQHEAALDWLAKLPNVDAGKIAFYGLSYGGKTAMRVPAVLPGYCLSICSGDFNEWTWKNTSIDYRGSYVFMNEYEMPEFNMGNTLVYAEMAALIAPRPFMVERGHDDGVGIDEWIGYEYAKVRRHFSRLRLSDQTEIEWFDGGHVVNGQGTFRFLQKHLGYPK